MKFFKSLFMRKTRREKYFDEQEKISTPWANFEIIDFDGDGVKVEFNWNAAFIEKIKKLGFDAETDEDRVQLFFFASQMKPTMLSENNAVQSEAHPNLSSSQNVIVK